MTVSELIEELRKYPPDMMVAMHPNSRLSPVLEVKKKTLRKETEDEYTFIELSTGIIQ